MPDPFEGSRLTLAWAQHHINYFDKKVTVFLDTRPYATVIEPNPQTPENNLHKMKLTASFPSHFNFIAADAVNNMRSALDQSVYAVAHAFAIASKQTTPKIAYFPFASDAAAFENTLKGRSAGIIPPEIQALFRKFQPYKGGNDLLWALNKICNGNKHKLVSPVGVATAGYRVKARSSGFMSVSETTPIWDRTKNEVVFAEIGKDADFEYNFEFGLFIAFDEVEIVGGKSAQIVLKFFAGEVESIISEIEAESKRIGIIS